MSIPRKIPIQFSRDPAGTHDHHPNVLVLASQSPRRLQILRRQGVSVVSHPVQVSEIPDENLNLADQIEGLARRKLEACLESRTQLDLLGNSVLAADTVVILDGQILGKPSDRQDARQALGRLAGRQHEVLTGVAICCLRSGRVAVGHQRSKITFRPLSDVEVEWYLDRGEWIDKAGGYGIQGRASRFVERLEGDFDCVVGLPMKLVRQLAEQAEVMLPMTSSPLASRLAEIYEQMAETCDQLGRNPWSVKLVGVAKTKRASLVVEALNAGLECVGENYVQEALGKQAEVKALMADGDPEWHFVGSLQSNKVKSVVGRFALIHSLDRLSLLNELGRRCRERSLVQDVLIEVNISNEATKGGLQSAELSSFVKQVDQHPHLRLRGLMVMPEIGGSESRAREQFRRVADCFRETRSRMTGIQALDFDTLSMGTTADFKVAIQEGSTLVRIGTQIFGSREGSRVR